MTFYDSHGKPIAYLADDSVHIYLFSGKPVAYIYDENVVYAFNGHHLGWFENGWVRDLRGYCVFFTEDATGSGPMKPMKQLKPLKGIKSIKPVKGVRQVKRVKATKCSSWSSLSGEQFFAQ